MERREKLDKIENSLLLLLDQIKEYRKEVKQISFPSCKVHKVVLYCKKCGKPFKGFLLDGQVLHNFKHPELYELCDECTPVKLKQEVEEYIRELDETALKHFGEEKRKVE